MDGDAVTVSTWHRAKGLEWPMVVLYGLEKQRKRDVLGVQMASDQRGFDPKDPLAGRWIRFWPTPYAGLQKGTPFRDRVLAAKETADVENEGHREALRLLYVGWTRARDRLVLAAKADKLLDGILGELPRLDPDLFEAPLGSEAVVWAGRTVDLAFRNAVPIAPPPRVSKAASVFASRESQTYPAAFVPPSSIDELGAAGEPELIGERIPITGDPDMADLGNAIHGFLAADTPDVPDREALARGLLESYGVAGVVDAPSVVFASDRFRAWADRKWPGAQWRREWPIQHRLDSGSIIRGNADLVLELEDAVVIVDHKSFPGGVDKAITKAETFGGQLRAYAEAITLATGKRVEHCFIHLPLIGRAIPVSVR